MSPRVGLDLQTLLQHATELADQEGLDGITLAGLAKKIGIRSPSIYNHVNGLADLRNHLAIYGMKQLADTLMRAAVGRSNDEALHAIASAYVEFARSHPGLYEATLRSPDPQNEELKKAASDILNIVVRVINGFGLQEEEALHAVRGFRSLLHGFSSLEQKGGFGLPLDLDVSLTYIVDTFLNGIQMKDE